VLYRDDLLGNTTVITDANGHATTIAYDPLSRPVEVRNAAGQYLPMAMMSPATSS
jgi:YD repeat-containing protein